MHCFFFFSSKKKIYIYYISFDIHVTSLVTRGKLSYFLYKKNYGLNHSVSLDVTIMNYIFRILYKIRFIGKERWYQFLIDQKLDMYSKIPLSLLWKGILAFVKPKIGHRRPNLYPLYISWVAIVIAQQNLLIVVLEGHSNIFQAKIWL